LGGLAGVKEKECLRCQQLKKKNSGRREGISEFSGEGVAALEKIKKGEGVRARLAPGNFHGADLITYRGLYREVYKKEKEKTIIKRRAEDLFKKRSQLKA